MRPDATKAALLFIGAIGALVMRPLRHKLAMSGTYSHLVAQAGEHGAVASFRERPKTWPYAPRRALHCIAPGAFPNLRPSRSDRGEAASFHRALIMDLEKPD
jgi:hypothetical protein